MSYSLALNGPSTTLELVNKLNLAIEEAKLVRRIIELNHQKKNIESISGPSSRTLCLGEEIIKLDSQLKFIRNRNPD